MTSFDPRNRANVRSAILDGMRELFKDGKGWCHKAAARDAEGAVVEPGSRSATSFCLLSGVWKVARGLKLDVSLYAAPAHALLKDLEDLVPDGRLMGWNDKPGRKHEDVLALLDKVHP